MREVTPSTKVSSGGLEDQSSDLKNGYTSAFIKKNFGRSPPLRLIEFISNSRIISGDFNTGNSVTSGEKLQC